MGKKVVISIIVISLVLIVIIWLNVRKDSINNTNESNTNIINQIMQLEVEKNESNYLQQSITDNEKKENINIMKIKINNNVFDVELEENEATKRLIEKLQNENITINAQEYGGFEKIGDLGFSLPKDDKNISTSAGDIVLYQGNKISLFYNSNSWSYTRIGKIKNISSNELRNILGSGDITLILSLN